jgi:hypothetical protein
MCLRAARVPTKILMGSGTPGNLLRRISDFDTASTVTSSPASTPVCSLTSLGIVTWNFAVTFDFGIMTAWAPALFRAIRYAVIRLPGQTLKSDRSGFSETPKMSDEILMVGKKGEIYTSGALRSAAGIRRGGKVRAKVVGGELVIDAVPSLEDVLRRPVSKVTVEEAERLSEEAQKEAGAHG